MAGYAGGGGGGGGGGAWGTTFQQSQNSPTSGYGGVYWIGQDNNVYVKGSQGTNAAGLADANTDSYWTQQGFERIADPNPSSSTPTVDNSLIPGGLGSGGGTDDQKANFINQSYDTKISGLRSILDTLNPQQDVANANVLNQYTNQSNALKGQKAIGERNLNLASEKSTSDRIRSLADLRRQVETQGRSYANQLGAYGAGDSSAAGLINQALSGMASRNRAGVVGADAEQQQAIGLQRSDLGFEFDNNMKFLEDWKSNSLNDIATKFTQQKAAIQQQMQTADADRYQALAQLDAAYTQQAIQQLAALEGQYRQSAQDLIGQYSNLQGPNVGIADNLQQFAVQPISAGKIQQISNVPMASNGATVPQVGYRLPFQEEYGIAL